MPSASITPLMRLAFIYLFCFFPNIAIQRTDRDKKATRGKEKKKSTHTYPGAKRYGTERNGMTTERRLVSGSDENFNMGSR
jgi:hypothetical protein